MQNVFSFIIVISLGFSQLTLAHDLKESLLMVDNDRVDTSTLYVKFKDLDPEGYPKATATINSLFGNKKGPQFSYRQLFRKINIARLRGYQYIEFKTPLTKSQARTTLRLLFNQKSIEYAMFHPKVEDAVFNKTQGPWLASQNLVLDPATTDLQSQQDYLQPAPFGIDAFFAWKIPGGTGTHVRIIDIETGWFIKHEDLNPPFWIGLESEDTFTDHGAAVAGELVALNNNKGVTGISHGSQFGFVRRDAPFGIEDYHGNMALAIEAAIEQLKAGDLLVLEMHSPGPTGEYIPVEYWEPVFDILQVARDKGIHCVAAAGNGGTNLDDPIFNKAFDLNTRDSGCIIVGASTHTRGNSTYTTASFSNYGSRIDAFGFGENVVTAGYGDINDGFINLPSEEHYTAEFSGTSSATPIVGGAIAVLSSMAQEKGPPISPLILRDALRKTGTPQTDATKNIGKLPNLVELHKELF